jgi:hypothetical protein
MMARRPHAKSLVILVALAGAAIAAQRAGVLAKLGRRTTVRVIRPVR